MTEGAMTVGSKARASVATLIVDDSQTDRMRLERLCRRTGMNIDLTEADGIETFRDAIDARSYDLVFIDYNLVGCNGLQVLAELVGHEMQETAAAIMITGAGELDVAVAAMRIGCSDYITKDQLTVEVLRKSIATAIEKKMMARALTAETRQREALESALMRFTDSCTSDLRPMMSAMLRRIRHLKSRLGADESARNQCDQLEKTCFDMWDYYGTFSKMVDRAAIEQANRPTPPLRLERGNS